MKAENLRSCNNRVRASVYPTNRIILTEHGIRQVAFPYYHLYNKMKLIVIIPAYNEEKNVKEVALKCRKYDDDVVIDDGSLQKNFDPIEFDGFRIEEK